ncbi:phosphoribosyltransferase [Mycobacterium sp. KBS0706]|uniref:phosphoribosyltransferase n=1 Tax=Mycobacterium sp. KBS0706 TaxID=2578109 RepID=UPI00110FCDCA|nr:phosphoribosyltransferase family protein [Mycobacterium sp. KBS0706]TSD85464.1 phosphoribosyltransferase [Mycobacterium sp. KBS0706]
MPYADRSDAGRRLASALAPYKALRPVILALPRGGVPVAAEVAAALEAPLDLILVRKIGVPSHPELAMGAVVDGSKPVIVRNDPVIRHAAISESRFLEFCRRELKEIERRRRLYLDGRSTIDIAGRVAIVIDDGIATGATVRAALEALRRRQPKRSVLAVPVGPLGMISDFQGLADEVVCLEDIEPYGAVGAVYRDFSQITDQEVIDLLGRFSSAPSAEVDPASN